MRILFINRSSASKIVGGDTVQMEKTAIYLRKLGVEVVIYQDQEKIDYSQYNLIHFFNITRPSTILQHVTKCDLPFVISTIFVDYSFYSKLSPWSTRGIATRIFGANGIEYYKAVAKHVLGKEKIEYLPYFWKGHKGSIKYILKKVNLLLPNSNSEIQRMQVAYGNFTKFKIIPNGIDTEKFSLQRSVERKSNQILCVGQIEPRKNQLNLIKAVNNSDFTLKIIGNFAINHKKYYQQCLKEAKGNIEFIAHVSQEKLLKHYQESAIHILPSWFETTGLVSLEAGFLGCKIIVTRKGDTEDYFGNLVEYCEPNSVESILRAIEKSDVNLSTNELKRKIEQEYTWDKAAKDTLLAYNKVTKKNENRNYRN